MSERLTIVRSGLPLPVAEPGEVVIPFDEFREWAKRGVVLTRLLRHREGRLLVHRLESSGRPLPLGLALRAMSRGRVWVEDGSGRRRMLTGRLLARWAGQAATEPFRVSALLRRVARSVDGLEREGGIPRSASLDLSRSPLYMRTDLSFGVRAGGSVGHIAGVVNGLGQFTGPPIVLTTDDVPTLKPDVEVHYVTLDDAFWNFRELPTFFQNDTCDSSADRALGPRRPAFVYQRYSLNNFSGIRVAWRHRVPLVLEYNGSEVWMGRHWGRPLKYERLSQRIEQLNLSSADLIVVVSRVMRDEVVARGTDASAVLVNPNGADTDRYRPDVDGRAVRERYGLSPFVVIGFIGTFGPWHGAETLARAFVRLLHDDPERAQRVRLLMIGDGAGMPAVRQILADGGAAASAVLTGLVPQEHGPEYLAACDVVASPHVANPDGTPFFGSPTKLFEYMAMGKGIVASKLGQIGEVLEHGRTSWLVTPGDVDALVAGLEHLIDDPMLRNALGAAARREVVSRYTWREHTRRTIARLQEIVSVTADGRRSVAHA